MELRRRKTWVKVLVAFIPTVLGMALFIISPLGINSGFPPSLWWANYCNRGTFERHQEGYREMAAVIKPQAADLTVGSRIYFELAPGREVPTLKRLPDDAPSATLDGLLADARLVEALRFRDGVAVRFVTRRVASGGAYSLIWWDPKPAADCVWWPTEWWENQHIDWIDGQWWSAYYSREHVQGWTRIARPPPKLD